MTVRQMVKEPSAFVPLVMSLAAITVLVIGVRIGGGIAAVRRAPDEETAALLRLSK